MPADLPMPVALDRARHAVLERAVSVAFGPTLLYVRSFTDVARPRCRRLTARRVRCGYRFTIVQPRLAVRLYGERGRVLITRRTQRVRPARPPRFTRDAGAR